MIQAYKIGIIKTIWFNLTKLPFRQAVRMPVVLARNTTVIGCRRGCFEFVGGGVVTACVTIGFNRNCNNGTPSSVNFMGRIIVRGKHCHAFGAGCHVTVKENAVLDIGDGFRCTGNTTISVSKSLIIGKDNLWSYHCAVLDNDGHSIYNEKGEIINEPKEVVFGEHVWVGNGCTILKGANIASGCVIASGSRINKVVSEPNSIVATDGRILKNNICWKS